MRQRIITAIFFVAAMVCGIFGGAAPFFSLFTLIGAAALWELGGLFFPKESPYALLRKILVICLGLTPILYLSTKFYAIGASPRLDFPLGIFLPSVGLLLLLELYLEHEKPFTAFGHTILGLFYIGLPIACMAVLAFKNGSYEPMAVMGIIFLIWVNDTMAYVVGRFLGKTPFWPRHSPKKTWEGTIGGAVFTLLAAFLFSQYFDVYVMPEWIKIGLVVAVLGTLGDLIESMLKRSVNIKDSGSLLPGHGGFLDRFDSFFFVLPFVYFLLYNIS